MITAPIIGGCYTDLKMTGCLKGIRLMLTVACRQYQNISGRQRPVDHCWAEQIPNAALVHVAVMWAANIHNNPSRDPNMIQGSCHCGSVQWQLQGIPESATACNCSACRRYGVLWAYDYEGEGIQVSGPTKAYVRGDSLGFHFCPECGCVAYWRSLEPNQEGRRRIDVNLRLTELEPIAHIPIDHFDGLDKWEDLPRDGRCIRDLWF